jgi:hypothetical protein
MTLLELVENRTGFRKQSANTWEGPCPKCGGTKRFVAWIKTDIFKCRDCDFKGDLIKFLREVEGYTCREAFLAVGKECGAVDCPSYDKCKGNSTPRRPRVASAIPPVTKDSDWQPREAVGPSDLWRHKAAEFVAWAHEQLLASPEQLQYLAGRGLPVESVIKNRLGFNPGALSKGKPGPLFKQRAAWGLDPKESNGKPVKVFPIQRGIIIPSFRGDDIYRIRIRRLDEDMAEYANLQEKDRPPKYLFLEGSGKGLIIRNPEAKAFLIVESDLCDLLADHLAGGLVCSVALTSCGVRPDLDSVGPLSSAVVILNSLDFELRVNASTGRDESPGGQNALWWKKHFPRNERHPVPIGKDVGEAWQQGVDIRAWVISGLPVSLQPRTSAMNRQKNENSLEENQVQFDHAKMQTLISDTFSRVFSQAPKGAQEWLAEKRPDIAKHLGDIGKAVDSAYAAEDDIRLIEELATWEKWHLAAWQRYKERPQILARCKMEGGDCVCCGNCQENEQE